MGQQSAASDDFVLESFLQYLKEQRFPCGVGERVRAYRLYGAFRPRVSEHRMKTVLCPVFARSDLDQERFYQAYDLFVGGAPPVQPRPVHPDIEPIAPPVDSDIIAARDNAHTTRWRRTMVVVVPLLATAIGLIWLATWIGQIISKPPAPVTTVVVPEQRQGFTIVPRDESRQTSYTRPCRHLECVTHGYRPLVLATFAALLIAAFITVRTPWWKRARIRARDKRTGPPFVWPIFRHSAGLEAYTSLLIRTAEAMRQRLAGEARDLDVPRTVDETIKKAGFPTLRFRPRHKAPDYLFLIERQHRDDHFACWWTDVATMLQPLGVSTRTFYYTGDLRRSLGAGAATAVNTVWLLDRFADSRVLVVGKGRDLLQGLSEIPGWIDASIVRRDQRALLTAAAAFAWGRAEHDLSRRMPIVPARLGNLAAAATGTTTGSRWRTCDAVEMPEVPPDYFDETEQDARGGRPALVRYLDDDVFQWLCACAAYPRVEWHLTLHIASAIDPSGQLLQEQKQLQLIRLPWFREGQIPGRWRAWLLKHLEPDNAAATRSLLLAALERNRAPKGSFARDFQDLQMAAQRHWLLPTARTLADLRASFDGLPDIDIAEDPLLEPLRAFKPPSPIAARFQLERARFTRLDWKVPATVLASVAAVLLGMRATPVADTHTDVVTRYEEVAVPKLPAAPPTLPPSKSETQVSILFNQRNSQLARQMGRLLAQRGIRAQVLYDPVAPRASEVRYYFDEDANDARKIAGIVNGVGIKARVVRMTNAGMPPRGVLRLALAATDSPQTTAQDVPPKPPANESAQQTQRPIPSTTGAAPLTQSGNASGATAQPGGSKSPAQQWCVAQDPPQERLITYEEFVQLVNGLGGYEDKPTSDNNPIRTAQWSLRTEFEKLLRVCQNGGIRVVGYAAANEGTPEERGALALRRANAVRDTLLQEIRADARVGGWSPTQIDTLPARISAIGAGDSESKCVDTSEACAQQNRRVEFKAFAYGAAVK